MSPLFALLLIAVAVSITVGTLVLIRRLVPSGGNFADSDRAAGVFGVVGTGFAVLLAFVIFIGFESFSTAKEAAERRCFRALRRTRCEGGLTMAHELEVT